MKNPNQPSAAEKNSEQVLKVKGNIRINYGKDILAQLSLNINRNSKKKRFPTVRGVLN